MLSYEVSLDSPAPYLGFPAGLKFVHCEGGGAGHRKGAWGLRPREEKSAVLPKAAAGFAPPPEPALPPLADGPQNDTLGLHYWFALEMARRMGGHFFCGGGVCGWMGGARWVVCLWMGGWGGWGGWGAARRRSPVPTPNCTPPHPPPTHHRAGDTWVPRTQYVELFILDSDRPINYPQARVAGGGEGRAGREGSDGGSGGGANRAMRMAERGPDAPFFLLSFCRTISDSTCLQSTLPRCVRRGPGRGSVYIPCMCVCVCGTPVHPCRTQRSQLTLPLPPPSGQAPHPHQGAHGR